MKIDFGWFKPAEAVQNSNDNEDGVFDPIYENICEKCRDLNLRKSFPNVLIKKV